MQIVYGSACSAFIFFFKSVETSISLFVCIRIVFVCMCERMYARIGLPIVKKRREKNIIRAELTIQNKNKNENEEWRRIKITRRAKRNKSYYEQWTLNSERTHACQHAYPTEYMFKALRFVVLCKHFSMLSSKHTRGTLLQIKKLRKEHTKNGNCAHFILAGWMRNTHSSQKIYHTIPYHAIQYNTYTFHTCTHANVRTIYK